MKILALGTCCVDVYPQKEVITPGGEALNIAAQLSLRDDVEVYLMGVVGNDDYANIIYQSISDLDINTAHLYQHEGKTAHHIIKIADDGDRYFESGSWHGGVSRNLTFNDADLALLDEVDIVIVTLWDPNLRQLVKLKTEKRFYLAVDFNDQRDFSNWEDIIDELDLFYSSAEESLKAVFLNRSLTTDTLFVLTFGKEGSYVYQRGNKFFCEADVVDDVIDTTGCGDCYQGHFAVEYFANGDIQQAMKIASEKASLVTSYVGGF